jgi:hypothetical protein
MGGTVAAVVDATVVVVPDGDVSVDATVVVVPDGDVSVDAASLAHPLTSRTKRTVTARRAAERLVPAGITKPLQRCNTVRGASTRLDV